MLPFARPGYVDTGIIDLRGIPISLSSTRCERTWHVCGNHAVVLPEPDLTSAKAIPDVRIGD